MNSGSCGLPEVSDEIVLVIEAELTLARPLLSSVTRSVVAVAGDGAAANDRCELESAVLSAEAIAPMPPEKFTPICIGLALVAFWSGSAAGSVTLTSVIWRCVLVVVSV